MGQQVAAGRLWRVVLTHKVLLNPPWLGGRCCAGGEIVKLHDLAIIAGESGSSS
jgi:hypothetical protein